MQIKKYTAPTLKEAMERMKEELGDEAVVLSTKSIEGDAVLGQQKTFEITAGIEDDYDVAKDIQEKPRHTKPQGFEGELKKLTEKIYGANKAAEESKRSEPNEKKPKPKKRFEAPILEEFKEVRDVLLQREVEEPIVDAIIKQLNKYSGLINSDNIDSYVISTLASMINTEGFEVNRKQKPKVISLVGPTGVGKTTCIAKLAVISKILHNLDVGLISIDTYRLGALDQLKILSEVSSIDFLVAYEPADLPKLMAKFKKKDLVFIDTVGRSQNSANMLKGIKDFLNSVRVDETYLVLSSTTTLRNMIDVAEKFRVLEYGGFVFSKIDEAVSYGNIANLCERYDTPIKYLTNGQVIPDDIIAAEPEFIANMIYTGKANQ